MVRTSFGACEQDDETQRLYCIRGMTALARTSEVEHGENPSPSHPRDPSVGVECQVLTRKKVSLQRVWNLPY